MSVCVYVLLGLQSSSQWQYRFYCIGAWCGCSTACTT